MSGISVDEKALGKRLQLARRRAGLTQQELCQKAGLSYSTLAKIERGAIRSPSVFTVAAVAAATATPIEDLLDMASKTLKSPAPADSKKRSKTGVRFVYFDVNGTLVRFFERAFRQIAEETGHPLEQVEMLYWRHDVGACVGSESTEKINKIFASELDIKDFDWQKYYLDNIEATPNVDELVRWAAKNYEVGLLTNNWLGLTDALLHKKLIPDVNWTVILESAKYHAVKPDPKIYEVAQGLANAEPSEIMLVDDNPPYLVGADQAGWHTVRFDGFHPDESITRVKSALEF
ncbi:MAG: HAD-IA family hydrolase [Candidatus Saccharimonadales bacterium]